MASEAQQQAQAEFDRADSQMKSLVAQMKQLGVETSVRTGDCADVLLPSHCTVECGLLLTLKRNMLSQLTFLGGCCSLQTTAQALRLCVKETKGLAIQKVRLQWADDAHAAQVHHYKVQHVP
jgi:hypothetical protein